MRHLKYFPVLIISANLPTDTHYCTQKFIDVEGARGSFIVPSNVKGRIGNTTVRFVDFAPEQETSVGFELSRSHHSSDGLPLPMPLRDELFVISYVQSDIGYPGQLTTEVSR
ncbi:uncharacterized protein ARMOST_12036 [Armillaria ostoyae]|uniref:Uncharacterized protein n=1 Tax=Armillaria ostoyae TaxID=47428 RepID=A0A284RIS8_ARMOS|nr:uncharacterized protein ARMOST_12036 [Armillaria ostoyae]